MLKKKYLFLFFLFSCFILSLFLNALPAEAADGSIKVTVDGKALVMEVEPRNIDGRILVPIRDIFEALGAKVYWDGNTRAASGIKERTNVWVQIENNTAKVNGLDYTLDVPAKIINGKTMVPARFIAESLGAGVDWDSATQTVLIASAGSRLIKDPNLEKTIKELLSKGDEELTFEDLQGVTSLLANEKGIITLDGIQNLTSLKWLYLHDNQITDLSPLSGMTGLMGLSLSDNQFTDISPLKGLTNLTILDLRNNALVNVSALKELKEIKTFYFENTKEKTVLGSEFFSKYDEAESIAQSIVDTVIKPGMSEIDKELALHDYLVRYVRYDTENTKAGTVPPTYHPSHSAYGVFVKKIAVCDGYARAMQVLLNKAGIECLKIDGMPVSKDFGPIGHSWNIVKIDGKYYQLDATWDDPVSLGELPGLQHKYFNLSDSQMASSHYFEPMKGIYKYPLSVNDNPVYTRSMTENRNSIISDKAYYFIKNDYIYKTDRVNGNVTKLCDDKADDINLYNDKLYFVNLTDGKKIYIINTDGSGKKMLFDSPASYLNIKDKQIYFIKDVNTDRQIYKVSIDGSKSTSINSDVVTTYLSISGDWLYYKVFNSLSNSGRLYRANSNSDTQPVGKDNVAGYVHKNNRIYWNYNRNEYIIDGWIYYVSASDGNKLCRMKIDGTLKLVLSQDKLSRGDENGCYYPIEVVGDWVYYRNADDKDKYYRVKTDGTGRVCVEQ